MNLSTLNLTQNRSHWSNLSHNPQTRPCDDARNRATAANANASARANVVFRQANRNSADSFVRDHLDQPSNGSSLANLMAGLTASFGSPEVEAVAPTSSASQVDNDAATAAFINNYLAEQGSPAADQNAGELMVKYGKMYDVDPLLLLAIAGHETVYGKEGIGMDGLLGVGAYDDDPNNATTNPEFSGVEAQIRRGAETFQALREQGGSSASDPIADQLAAVNQAGWATDPDWHSGVQRHYEEIQQSNPPAASTSAAKSGKNAGLEALGFGYDQPAINPNTGDTNWNGWGLGWVNQALQSQGVKLPELQADNAADAFGEAQAAGKIQQGAPQPGSVIFFQDGDRTRIGIVGPDGTTVRTTQEPDAQGRTVGDIPMPDQVKGWLDPGATMTSSSSTAPVDGVSPSDPASFFITQNTTQWNPDARYIDGKNANCGPTSLAMAALAFGKLPPGTDKNHPEDLIEAVRVDMTGADDISAPTDTEQVKAGAQALGMSYHDVGTLDSVNSALADGQMVVAGSTDHFVLIVGRTSDGNYIVNDPFYTGQPGVIKTPAEMAEFFVGGVAVGP